jgi:Tfp pilus assembly protein PilF
MNKHLIVLVLLCTTLSALGTDSANRWNEVKSPHFIILTDASSKQAVRIASQFEEMRSVFHNILPNATGDSYSPIVVLALKNKRGFQALEPESYLTKGQLNLSGLFMHGPDKNYILLRLDAESEHPFSVVYHEYTHFMTSGATWMPLWLNEGLAEFYQNTDINEKDVLLGQPSADDILFLRQNRLLPLAILFKVDYASPYYHDEQKGSVFYSESWALTHYLMMSDHENHTNRVLDYSKLVSQNQDPLAAAQQAFGDLKLLQRALESYVQNSNFKMFKMSTGVTVDASSFQERTVSQPEVDAIRADVLIRNQRNKEAEALLDTSLSAEPNSAIAHEAMGFLKFREGDAASAKKWYGEAVQLDSHSSLAHYYYAEMSLQAGDTEHDAAIESSLRASIKLNPMFAPAYDALATFYATRDKNLDEAHMLNAKAIQIEPQNLSFRMNAANVLSQQRQYISAEGVLKVAKSVAKTPEEVSRIEKRIQQLEEFQTAMDRAAKAGVEGGSAQPSVTPSVGLQADSTKTIVFRRVNGKMIGTSEEAPNYPAGNATGARHTISGVLRDVQCSYPNVLALRIDTGKQAVALYNNNYYKIVFTEGNYTSDEEIKPCTDIEGMKAKIDYAEVTDKVVAGQIVSIELSK